SRSSDLRLFKIEGGGKRCRMHPGKSRRDLSATRGPQTGEGVGPPQQAAEKPFQAVIPSGARNLALNVFKVMRDSSSPAALSKVTSFPRKRESVEMGPRFRGGDEVGDFHPLAWAKGPWKLLGMTGQTSFSAACQAAKSLESESLGSSRQSREMCHLKPAFSV